MSWPQKVRDKAADRSKLRCEGCGGPGPFELHHRQYKSRGGQNVLSNALVLCGWGNHTGCHGRAHSKAGEEDGWAVRSGFVPAEVEVVHAIYGVVLLGDDGSVTRIQQPEEGD